MIARIYSPAKTAMQSANPHKFWILEYNPYLKYSNSKKIMTVRFKTKEEAIAFACKNHIIYHVEKEHNSERKKISYSDNFRANRTESWTH
ncbi:MAG: NADH-ubiquinone oxidoreductase [Candidatus Tokpelaia sp. JSC161]|nr:MAG: NADH-ubiquinone oxidoreductase [Candidatus Tokpelaia sp. JSC161]